MKTIKVLYIFSVTLFSVIFLLLFAEVLFRVKLLGYKKAYQSFFKKTNQPSVLGTNNWVISDPDLGYRLNPNLPEINEFSMKEKEIQIPKPSGVKRIIILGDSIPYSGNPSFVDLLKNKFSDNQKIEILNASTPGFTTYQELVFLKKILINTQPDLIILTYCLNDNYTFLHRFDEKANMLWTQEAKDSLQINNLLDKLISKSYFLSSLKILIQQKNSDKNSIYPWENSIDFNLAWKDYSWLDFGKRFNEMNEISKKINSKLIVIIFPLGLQFNENMLRNYIQVDLKPQRNVIHYSKKLNIPYLDLFPVFYSYITANEGKKLFTDGLHLNNEGHILTANAIHEYLLNNSFTEK